MARALSLCILFGLIAFPPLLRLAQPSEPPDTKASLEAALRVSKAAAAEYEIQAGDTPLKLQPESVFRWSNPEVGDIDGNVFLWTRGTRPIAVGSFFHYLSARPSMEHEFHSLSEEPLAAKFHGDSVWATKDAGLKFAKIPGALPRYSGASQRWSELKKLAQGFTGLGIFGKNSAAQQLRLLPQPIYRYIAPDDEIVAGGLFAFVRATDPEILLLIEAQGTEDSTTWRFAAVRMHSVAELWLQSGDQRIWQAEPLPLNEIFEQHQRPYTAFKFREIPEFLNP